MRLNNIERVVLAGLWGRGGLACPDFDAVEVTRRNTCCCRLHNLIRKNGNLLVSEGILRFPERVYSELHGLLDGVPVGFVVFFDGEYVDAIEGYSHLDQFPSRSQTIEIVGEDAINRLLRSGTGCPS